MKKRPTAKKRKKAAIGGPFLTIATICERVLHEKDGVQSLVRVFDKLTLTPMQADIPQDANSAQCTLVVQLRSGDFVGTKTLRIRPLNRPGQEREIPLVFGGNESGPLVVVEMNLAVALGEPELWWFDISLDEQTISRVPLRIEHQTAPAAIEVQSEKKKKKPPKVRKR